MKPPLKYPFLEPSPKGVFVKIRLQPRASRNEISGIQKDALKVKLTAPPVEGEANKSLIAFLSKTLGIKKSALKIASGEKSRDKRVLVAGFTLEDVEKILNEKEGGL
ncbi:MAG: DUF167 domain-containing protein [Thermodesulfobacteriota bacterium]